jgi:aminomethyltransferase
MVTSTLAQTPLHDWHAAHGGRMVDFAGWSMPVQYSSIVAEHTATRTAAGLFDVSHMGRLRFTGNNTAEFLESLLTRRVSDMEPGQVLHSRMTQPGQVRYSLMTNEQGGILDDVLVYRLMSPLGSAYYWMVVNASNREKICGWINRHLQSHNDIQFTDMTMETAMIAVQGPLALQLLQPQVDVNLATMKYYHAIHIHGLRQRLDVIFSRTGYTGEDGFELIMPATAALQIWESILAAGASQGVMAAGLGARDTLRLEAAMPLYGHELNEQINPLEAGLGFAVNLEGRKFPGSEVLTAVKRDGPKHVRVGLELSGKRPAREHYAIYAGSAGGTQSSGPPIGEITSGTFSPTLQKPIAMGYVPPQFAQPGNELFVDIRGAHEPARVVKLPFYKRS